MPRFFTFELDQIRSLLEAVRLLENKKVSEAMVANLRAQVVGPVAKLEPFMRGRDWLRTEIEFEKRTEEDQYNNKCECGRPCKGKMCAPCWRAAYKILYGDT
jgi:hypothetical protein